MVMMTMTILTMMTMTDCEYGGFAKCFDAKNKSDAMVRPVRSLVADGHTETAIP